MRKLLAQCGDLNPVASIAAIAFVAVAVFAWAEKSALSLTTGWIPTNGSGGPGSWERADYRRGRRVDGLAQHPPRGLGTQPGVGYFYPGGLCQHIQRRLVR